VVSAPSFQNQHQWLNFSPIHRLRGVPVQFSFGRLSQCFLATALISMFSLGWEQQGRADSAGSPLREGSSSLSVSQRSIVVQADPISSPYPLPWKWVETSLAAISQSGRAATRTYASPKLISPDGEYLAFCQIQIQGLPQSANSQINSTLIIQNRKTGAKQSISLDPGYTRHPERPSDLTGSIVILWPVGWSQSGDRLLVRNFSGLLGSDIASDSALVWYRQSQSTASFNPQPMNYDTAILLGWSSNDPKQVLFRTYILGETQEQMWAVNEQNQTIASPGDRPLIYGERLPEDRASL
jgi:hypothetical protein